MVAKPSDERTKQSLGQKRVVVKSSKASLKEFVSTFQTNF
jgi:hypothetical protein